MKERSSAGACSLAMTVSRSADKVFFRRSLALAARGRSNSVYHRLLNQDGPPNRDGKLNPCDCWTGGGRR